MIHPAEAWRLGGSEEIGLRLASSLLTGCE
jgi:hypothetical protein